MLEVIQWVSIVMMWFCIAANWLCIWRNRRLSKAYKESLKRMASMYDEYEKNAR